MPYANYCRKCKTEVPVGDSCAYCGGKLTKAGERISFGAVVTPVRDWFSWNVLLRVCLAPLGLALALALAAELIAEGVSGVVALVSQGFFRVALVALAAMLAGILAILALQGRENVHYVLDKDGVRALTYLVEPRAWQFYARFTSPETKQSDNDEELLEGFTLVRRVFIPWAEVRRLRLWRENATMLFYRPSFWLALAMRCPPADFADAEAYAQKKLKRPKRASRPKKAKKT